MPAVDFPASVMCCDACDCALWVPQEALDRVSDLQINKVPHAMITIGCRSCIKDAMVWFNHAGKKAIVKPQEVYEAASDVFFWIIAWLRP